MKSIGDGKTIGSIRDKTLALRINPIRRPTSHASEETVKLGVPET